MAEGLSSEYDIDWTIACQDCELPDTCCDESCEGRIWVAPCGTIDYLTGEILNIANFCEPQNVTAMSFTDNAVVREKQYRGCKKSRRRGMPDLSWTITWDICQGDAANVQLLGRCSFDYVIAPKGNNLNFELNPSILDQNTYTAWGRAVGDTFTWEFPDDDCQNTTRTFMTDRYCFEGQIEALANG